MPHSSGQVDDGFVRRSQLLGQALAISRKQPLFSCLFPPMTIRLARSTAGDSPEQPNGKPCQLELRRSNKRNPRFRERLAEFHDLVMRSELHHLMGNPSRKAGMVLTTRPTSAITRQKGRVT